MNFHIRIFLLLTFCFSLLLDGSIYTIQAAPRMQAMKVQKSSKKEKDKKARINSREKYEQAVAEIEAYNAHVERYNARDITHSILLWGQIGYSAIVPSRFSYSEDPACGFNQYAKGGVGGGLGAGYHLRYQRFILQTGLEFQAYSSTNTLYSTNQRQPMLTRLLPVKISSPDGPVDAEALYTFANTTDQMVAGYIQLPILMGYQMQSVPLYVLAGPKFGLNVLHSSHVVSDASVRVHDKELIADLSDLYTHNLSATRLDYASSPRFQFNLALAAELGWRLDAYMPDNWRARIGAFIEYGVMNIQSSSNVGTMELPFSLPEAGQTVDQYAKQMCSSIETSSAATARLNPLLAGIRMSVMYDLPRKQLKKKRLPKPPKTNVNIPRVEITAPTIAADTIRRVVTFGDIQLRVGMKVKIDNLFFATNKTEVLPQSGPALENLANFMKDNPSVKILLIGHTDSIGTERDNQRLSEGRVQSVKNELVKRGVEASRMTIEGRGESQPVDTNSTEEGRQNNRRVEFTITSLEDELGGVEKP